MVCSISRQNFSNMIGERETKLIIAKQCGHEKLTKNIQGLYLYKYLVCFQSPINE